MKLCWFALPGLILWTALSWGQTAALRVEPPAVTVLPGETVQLRLLVSSQERIAGVQFTLEYDAHIIAFRDASISQSLAVRGFTVSAVNENLAFAPQTPNTNENVLVQIFSYNNWFVGEGMETCVLTFTRESEHCSGIATPLAIDPDHLHTQVVTFLRPALIQTLQVRGASIHTPCTRIRLFQNKPNPFNPSTSIVFEIPHAGHVFLRLFNARGRLVRTLVDSRLSAGRHEETWDGRDQDGRAMAAGLYVYRLDSSGRSLSRRSLLLK